LRPYGGEEFDHPCQEKGHACTTGGGGDERKIPRPKGTWCTRLFRRGIGAVFLSRTRNGRPTTRIIQRVEAAPRATKRPDGPSIEPGAGGKNGEPDEANRAPPSGLLASKEGRRPRERPGSRLKETTDEGLGPREAGPISRTSKAEGWPPSRRPAEPLEAEAEVAARGLLKPGREGLTPTRDGPNKSLAVCRKRGPAHRFRWRGFCFVLSARYRPTTETDLRPAGPLGRAGAGRNRGARHGLDDANFLKRFLPQLPVLWPCRAGPQPTGQAVGMPQVRLVACRNVAREGRHCLQRRTPRTDP